MILLTGRDTGLPAYIFEKEIVRIEEMKEQVRVRSHPFTRVFLQDEKSGYEYFLDVKEKKKEIEKMLEEEKRKHG